MTPPLADAMHEKLVCAYCESARVTLLRSEPSWDYNCRPVQVGEWACQDCGNHTLGIIDTEAT